MMDYNNLMAYACNIIPRTQTFREFAVAMMEYMDEPSITVVKLYEDISRLPLPDNIRIDRSFTKVDVETLQKWYYSFKEEQAKMEKESMTYIKVDIDELTNRIRECRNGEKFKEELDFVGKLYYLAPYNAWLVKQQKPGAELVFSISKWRKYGRRPKLNGQKLITLVPFGPVQIMYEYSDTEHIDEFFYSEREELLERYYNQFTRTQGEINPGDLKHLIDCLPTYGISLHTDFNAASTFAGYIRQYNEDKLTIIISSDTKNGRTGKMEINSRYAISLNCNHQPTVRFVSLCHELGHLFCRHMFYDLRKVRRLTHKEKEFEAETVAWLVCKRLGIYNPSEEYLANFVINNQTPKYSLDCIFKAVNEIEKMLRGPVAANESLLYKYDSEHKSAVDKEMKALRDTMVYQR